MIRKVLALLLTLLLGVMSSCIVLAEDLNDPEPVDQDYAYAQDVVLSIRLSGNSVVCHGYVSSRDSSTTTSVTITLQRKLSASSIWSYVCSWSGSVSGTAKAIASGNHSVSSGYDYRIRMYWKISNSSGTILENGTEYSNVVSY